MKTDFRKVTGIGKETKRTLQENIQDLIHPWQYKDSEIHIVNIDSDITDIETNWNQEIRFRYGFNINEDKSLNIPTMFVQMNGIYSNKADYRALIEKMTTKNTIRYKNTDGLFDSYNYIEVPEARLLCKNNEVRAFEKVNTSTQKMMNKKLLEFIDRYEHEVKERTFQRILGNIINIEEPQIIALLQNFDYCFNNPKIIVENMDDNNFTDVSKYVLIFLYNLGFDILIFSPKGSSFLKSFEINTITLEKYLPPTEDKYDYREDEEIKRAEKEEKKLEKKKERERTKWDRRRKRNCILLTLVAVIGTCALIGLLSYAIWEEETSKKDFQKITDNMTWNIEPTIMYINSDDTIAYPYATEEATQSCTYDKDDEVKVIGISNDWVRIKTSSSTVYVKKENVREEMYDIDISNFIMKIKVGEEINAYTFPDMNTDILHTYKVGNTMNAIGYNSDWYQIDYHGDVGFVNRDELVIYEELEEESQENTEVETENTETESETEEVLDGEITEDSDNIGLGLILGGIVIFLLLCLIFALIML